MVINAHHPAFDEFLVDIQTCRDVARGERVIKEKGTLYLPATAGQIIDGQGRRINSRGERSYQAYKNRAVFPDVYHAAIGSYLGILNRKPMRVKLPAQLEHVRDHASVQGESLEMLYMRINEQQLSVGRVGLMLDLPDREVTLGGMRPLFSLWFAEHIINWDMAEPNMMVEVDPEHTTHQALNLVVLDESGPVRVNTFEWEERPRYRVLSLGGISDPDDNDGLYHIFTKDGDDETDRIPQIKGEPIKQIPFIIINSKDILPEPDDPPLLGLANLALACYKLSADHRSAMYMTGQDTLVVKGGDPDKTYRVGAGATITVNSEFGDAKYISTSARGLSEMRHQLENDEKKAAIKGAQLIDTTSRQRESGDALRIRVSAQTATLHQIAKSSAEGLKRLLQMAATWVGADPGEVDVEPNLSFADDSLSGKVLLDLVTAKNLGAPFTDEEIHDVVRKMGMTDREYNDIRATAESERAKTVAAQVKAATPAPAPAPARDPGAT